MNTKVTVIKVKYYWLKTLNKIRSYLRDLVYDLKHSDTWKIQLTITINFISPKRYKDEDCVMYSKSDNIEILRGDEGDEVIEIFLIHLKIDIRII